jgi:hypothetical protein
MAGWFKRAEAPDNAELLERLRRAEDVLNAYQSNANSGFRSLQAQIKEQDARIDRLVEEIREFRQAALVAGFEPEELASRHVNPDGTIAADKVQRIVTPRGDLIPYFRRDERPSAVQYVRGWSLADVRACARRGSLIPREH